VVLSSQLKGNEVCRFPCRAALKALPPTVSLLIDQSSTNINKFAQTSFAILFSWSIWSFVALTLNQFYKGVIFLFLTSSPAPWVPNTLGEILDSNLDCTTQTQEYMTEFDETEDDSKLVLSSVVKISLSETLQLEGYSSNPTLVELYRKIKWFGGDYITTIFRLIKNIQIYIYDSSSKVKVSKDFFIIDSIESVSRFRLHLRMYSDKWVSNTKPLPVVRDRKGWIVYQNCLYSVLKNMFAQLFESGLYSRWERYYNTQKKNEDNSALARKMREKLYELSASNSAYKESDEISYENDLKIMPISLKMVKIMFLYALASLAAACALFCREVSQSFIR